MSEEKKDPSVEKDVVEKSATHPKPSEKTEDSKDAKATEATEGNTDTSAEALEESFFASDPKVEEEDILEQVVEVSMPADEPLWGEQKDPIVPPVWQPVLPLAMVLISLFVMSVFWDDMSYFFAPRQVLDLGSVKDGCTPAFYKSLRHNRWVKVGGIFAQPGMTAEARVRFHKRSYAVVMGCNLLVSMPKEQFYSVATRYFGITGRSIQAIRTEATEPLRRYYEPSGILEFTPNTYIFYANEHPNHQWWLVLVYLGLGALLLYNARSLASSVWRNWIKGEQS